MDRVATGFKQDGPDHIGFVDIPLPEGVNRRECMGIVDIQTDTYARTIGAMKGVDETTDSGKLILQKAAMNSPFQMSGFGGYSDKDALQPLTPPVTMEELMGIDPYKIMNTQVDIGSLSYGEAGKWGTRFMRAGNIFGGRIKMEGQTGLTGNWKACFEKAMDCWIRAFSLHTPDLLMSSIINELEDDARVGREFPDKFMTLLEIAAVAKHGKKEETRFEFFDAYLNFAIAHGRGERFYKFVEANFEALMGGDKIYSRAFNFIAKGRVIEGGDEQAHLLEKKTGTRQANNLPVRIEVLRKSIKRNKLAKKSAEEKHAYCKEIGNIIMGDLILGEGDYVKAKALRDEFEWLFDFYPEIKKKVDYCLNTHIPPFISLAGNGKSELAIKGRPDSIAAVRNKTRSNKVAADFRPQLETLESQNDVQGGMRVVVDLIKTAYFNDDFFYNDFVLLASLCMQMLDEFFTSQEQINIFIHFVRDELIKSGVVIPPSILNMMNARLIIVYQMTGQPDKMEELSKKLIYSYDGSDGCEKIFGVPLLTILEYATSTFDGTQDPENLRFLMTTVGVAAAHLPQLEGFSRGNNYESFEEEVWCKLFIPKYNQYKEPICANVDIPRALASLSKIIAKSPARIAAHEVRLELALRCDKVKPPQLQQYWKQYDKLMKPTSEEQISKMDHSDISRCLMGLHVANGLYTRGQKKEAYDVLREIKIDVFLEKGAQYSEQAKAIVGILLGNPKFTEEDYCDCMRVVEVYPESIEEVETLLAEKRAVLDKNKPKEKLTPELKTMREFFEGIVSNPNLLRMFGGDDNVRLIYMFGEIAETIEFLRESLNGVEVDEAKAGKMFEVGMKKSVSVRTLNDDFGIEKIGVKIVDGKIQVHCDFGDNKMIVVDFDSELRMQIGDFEFRDDDSSVMRLALQLFEAALLEAIYEITFDDKLDLINDLAWGDNFRLDELRANLGDGIKEYEGKKIETKGMDGIEERNAMVVEQLLGGMDDMKRHPNFPAPEQVTALIEKYIELIGESRSLDNPVGFYTSAVDAHSPFAVHLTSLKILSKKLSKTELSGMGINDYEVNKLMENVGGKSNFAGYYQLRCKVKGVEIPLSVFLDKKGTAYIPGVPRHHPLYEYLWMITLECLAARVVSELDEYGKILRNDEETSDEDDDTTHPQNGKPHKHESIMFAADEITRKKHACAMLLIGNNKRGSSPEEKIATLSEISDLFRTVELATKNFSQWNLYVKRKNEYIPVENLFIEYRGINYLDVNVLKFVLGEDIEIPKSRRVDTDEKTFEVVHMADISEDVREKLCATVRVETMSGRTYRMPVRFVEESSEIGQNHLKKPHTKVVVNEKPFMAIPNQMTPLLSRAYDSDSTVEGRSMRDIRVVYAVLYDPSADKFLAWKHVGFADKGADGKYLNIRVRKFHEAHEKGELAIMKYENGVMKSHGNKEGLQEIFFEVDTTTGYKRGVFPFIGKYLNGDVRPEEVANSILIDSIKKRMGDNAVREFEIWMANLAAQAGEANHKKMVEQLRRARERKEALAEQESGHVKLKPYRIDVTQDLINGSKNAGLRGRDLYIMDERHPLYKRYLEALNPRPYESLVMIDRPGGRVAKAITKLLTKKTKDQPNIPSLDDIEFDPRSSGEFVLLDED